MDSIVISPSDFLEDEAKLINTLFVKGIKRYHLNKSESTEQQLAEILEKVDPKYISKITLHSHYHLVLAYGVGGIHFSYLHRKNLPEDFPQKVALYQSFGIIVSTDILNPDESFEPADFAILIGDTKAVSGKVVYSSSKGVSINATTWFKLSSLGENMLLSTHLK